MRGTDGSPQTPPSTVRIFGNTLEIILTTG